MYRDLHVDRVYIYIYMWVVPKIPVRSTSTTTLAVAVAVVAVADVAAVVFFVVVVIHAANTEVQLLLVELAVHFLHALCHLLRNWRHRLLLCTISSFILLHAGKNNKK